MSAEAENTRKRYQLNLERKLQSNFSQQVNHRQQQLQQKQWQDLHFVPHHQQRQTEQQHDVVGMYDDDNVHVEVDGDGRIYFNQSV